MTRRSILLRLTQLDHLLRQGVFFSRWAPDMAQGYGFPFFNFYAPLSYYLAEAVGLLAGNLNLGMRITFALSVYLAGLMAYRLSRDHFSRPAALVTAVAYMYAPYFAYDILFRGNLAESVAWLFLPLSLWTMGRLARTGQNRWLAAAALSYAAVLLTHNVFALIFSPLLGLYGLVASGEGQGVRQRRRNLHSFRQAQEEFSTLYSLAGCVCPTPRPRPDHVLLAAGHGGADAGSQRPPARAAHFCVLGQFCDAGGSFCAAANGLYQPHQSFSGAGAGGWFRCCWLYLHFWLAGGALRTADGGR
ncbi:MAG: glycosyltransferase family 39 protein [Chloroflexi bacterium]|nr:glycosyltransferase family 39 protein [Chloroflexota bacterium]